MARFRADPWMCSSPGPRPSMSVEQALKLVPRPGAIVDVGCGSGAIAIAVGLEAGARSRVLGDGHFAKRWLWRAKTPSGSARGSAL